MKDTEIKIGKVYDIKVGKNTSAVRIMRLAEKEGWEAVSLKNNNPVIIRSASRIVGVHNPKPSRKKKTDTATAEAKAPKERKGGLTAAAKVLQEAGEPLNCQQMVKAMIDKGLWTSEGKTPQATIYSAIIREIKAKGNESRFRKTERGKFIFATK